MSEKIRCMAYPRGGPLDSEPHYYCKHCGVVDDPQQCQAHLEDMVELTAEEIAQPRLTDIWRAD